MPNAYVLCDITVTDPDAYETYKALAGPSVTAHGGHYIARGGAAELLEGEGAVSRIVVIEFPDMDSARGWYNSPEYGEARAARSSASTARIVVVEGSG